jgi:DNA polymerase-1
VITFDNGVKLIQSQDELPNLVGAKDVFADFETSSGHPKLTSLNPWKNCGIAGLGVTVDKAKGAWFIPDEFLPTDWWQDVLDNCERWINHNVKYDAHVSANCRGVLPACAIVDTLTLAKIIDSDRIMRGGYSLKALSKGWLHEDIEQYEARLQPYLHNNKDYGSIPVDILAEYGGQDVITNRRLWHYEDSQCPDQCRDVWNTEIELTSVLFDIERNGMCVNKAELQLTELKLLNRMQRLDDELTELVGSSFRPHVNEDCYDILCNQYGLPVLGWTNEDDPTKKSNPSFDKKTLAKYAAHPYAPQDVVSRIQKYRKINTQVSFFVRPYQEHQVDGRLHPSYNQCVRTGRMSCKEPNSQQLDELAKRLIHPSEGYTFLSYDYAQIEFRTIVHYIKDPVAIAAYAENPDTDFHDWVAGMCAIKRKPAKSVNFCMGYGGGKNRLISMLATNMDLVGSLKKGVDKLVTEGKIEKERAMQVFEMLCRQRAEKVFNTYHATLPSLKTTSWRAEAALKRKGYVFNACGRRRHLPEKAAHRAFNTLNQSLAADIMKERTVALAKACKGTPIRLIASVHDETLLEAPNEIANDPRTTRDIVDILEHPGVDLRVPIRVSYGRSTGNWRDASKIDVPIDRSDNQADQLAWLRP